MSTVRVALTCWHLAWMSQLGRRLSFLLQMLFMVLNDSIWVVFWLLVFSHKSSIRGWERDEVLVLFSIITFSYGIGIGLFYGVRRLGRRIRDRDLDPWLAQPRPVLVRILFGKVHPPLLGDLAFGPILFVIAGAASFEAWPRYVAVALLAASIVVAFNVAWESAAFWSETGNEVAGVAFTAITVLSTYPAAIYTGVVKLVVFTVVPAAFIGSIPAEVVLDPSPRLVAGLVTAAVVSWIVALGVFHLGLRRYLRAH
jgi:ABC-2 type transport system permease protein